MKLGCFAGLASVGGCGCVGSTLVWEEVEKVEVRMWRKVECYKSGGVGGFFLDS